MYLLAIRFKTLHDSGDTKLIVPLGTIESPVYIYAVAQTHGSIHVMINSSMRLDELTQLQDSLCIGGTSFGQDHHKTTPPE